MIKKDLLDLINAIGDDQEVDEALKDSELVKKFSGLDTFKEKINTDKDFKAFMDSEKDKHASKSLDTWKSNNLQKLIDEALAKANAKETPEQKQIRELTERLNQKEADEKRQILVNKALKIVTEKNIPSEFLDYFVGSDEESTMDNLNVLETALGDYSKIIRSQILAEGSYTPKKNFSNSNTTANPYKKETFSLTQQMELEKNNPTLAAQFKSQIDM